MALEDESKDLSDAMEEMRRTGTLSAETLEKLNGKYKEADAELSKFNKQVKSVTKDITSAMGQLAKGEGSFQSMSGSIQLAIGGIAKFTAGILSSIPLVGGAAKALAEGVGDAANFILQQLDAMAKNYQTLGDASAGAADGVDGLLRQFNQMGNYSLPAFTKAVKANMSGLMAFKGTASEGAEELSKIAGALTTGDTARKFLKLGMSLDGVGDAAAHYAADFGRMGLTQGQSTDELTKKTQAYILEVDQIARLTGQSREAQQKAQQQTLADVRARALLGEMSANGQTEAAKQLSTLMGAFDASTNAVIRASATGIPLTEDAQKASVYTNNVIAETAQAVYRGEIDAVEGTARIRKALASGADQFRTLSKYTANSFGGIANAGEDAAATEREVAELRKKTEYAGLSDAELVKVAQQRQAEASGDTTQEFVDAQLAVADSNKSLQRLGFTLAREALPAVDAFAKGLRAVTGFMDQHFGSGIKGGATGRGNGPGYENGAYSAPGGGKAAGDSKNAETAMKFFQSAGWTKEQAAGIVGNLQTESGKNLDVTAIGDNGQARGIAQWHPDRQAQFEKTMGKKLSESTLEEQLKFVDWELKNTNKEAGDKLKQAKSAAHAAAIVDKEYERSSGAAIASRVASAVALYGDKSTADATSSKASAPTSSKAPAPTSPKAPAPTQAVVTAPTGRYPHQVSTVQPPDKKVENATHNTASAKSKKDIDDEHLNLLQQILGHMEITSYASQKTADATHKTAKNTQG